LAWLALAAIEPASLESPCAAIAGLSAIYDQISLAPITTIVAPAADGSVRAARRRTRRGEREAERAAGADQFFATIIVLIVAV
jgi:hypothetical protein